MKAPDWNQFDLISFDLFDTLIVRNVPKPIDIFYMVKERLHEEATLPSCAFPFFRRFAELLARKFSRDEEVDLKTIYQMLSRLYPLVDSARSKKIMEIEELVELESISRSEEFFRFYEQAKQSGKQVIITSDTYFDFQFIRHLLQRLKIEVNSQDLHLSSELKLTKHSGSIYPYLQKKYKVHDPKKCLQIGDNAWSDVKSALAQGWSSLEIQRTRDSEFDIYFRKFFHVSKARQIAGLSRLARLKSGSESSPYFQLGCYVAGPILVEFVRWVLEELDRLGIEQCYFLSRDGQVLHEIAKILNDGDRKLRYLYASRQAWHLPALKSFDADQFDWITEALGALKPSKLAQRLEVDVFRLIDLLQEMGVQVSSPEQAFSPAQIQFFKANLEGSMLAAHIKSLAKERRELALKYFDQEGLFQAKKFAIVDLGWKGRLQNSLERILSQRNVPKVSGLYFGLHRPPLQNQQKCHFFSGPTPDRYFRVCSAAVNLLELFTSADHGSCVGYIETDDQVKPKLQDAEHVFTGRNWQDYREGIYAYARESSAEKKLYWPPEQGLDFLYQFLRSISLDPPRHLVEIVQSLPFDAEQGAKAKQDFAPRISSFEAILHLLKANRGDPSEHSFWPGGSRVRSGVWASMLMSPIAFVVARPLRLVRPAMRWVYGYYRAHRSQRSA